MLVANGKFHCCCAVTDIFLAGVNEVEVPTCTNMYQLLHNLIVYSMCLLMNKWNSTMELAKFAKYNIYAVPLHTDQLYSGEINGTIIIP